MEAELAELRDKVVRLEAEVDMLRDIVKSYIAAPKNRSSVGRLPQIMPKAKLSWKAWLILILMQAFGGLLRWVPIDLFIS